MPVNDDGQAQEPTDHLVSGPARDIQLITNTAVLGFRGDNGSFHAGFITHDVSVQGGLAELTPYHYTAPGQRVTGGTLGIETAAISREDGTQIGGSSIARSNAAGAVEIARGAALEVLTNREDGIQQAWTFASAPQGTGDLTVDVEVSGQAFVAANASGLHFQSPAGLGFRYSHALWLDSAGHEWSIDATWKDDHISITVPADLIAATTFPATLDPTITAEVAVDTQVTGTTGTNATAPAIAFDGTNYLVVWADQRLSRDEDIFATLVSQTGTIVTATGITVSTSAGRQLNPTVAFAGTKYVVAWEDFKISGGAESDIGAATVTTAGVVTQLGHVAASAQNETGPKIAANGSNALVVWNNAGDIHASLFNGTSFGGAIAITADATAQATPNVTAKPTANYLVAYSEGDDVAAADLRGQFVTTAGVKSGAVFTISAAAGRQYDPSLAYDGTNYIAVWSNNNVGLDLFGTRVTTAGVVLDTRSEGVTANIGGVAIDTATGNQELSALVCNAGGCFVTWQEGRNAATTAADIYAVRLVTSPALAPSGAEIVVSNAVKPQFLPAVVTNGTDFFTVWQDTRDNNSQTIFGARVTAGGAVTDTSGIVLVTGNNRETTPAVGRAGTTFGVFWADSRNYGTDIEMVRFSGVSKLDATALVVSNATFAQTSPSVTASPGNFYAVWNDTRNGVDRDIFGTRVDAAGTVLDPAGTAISIATGDQLVPSAASNGAVTLVVWQDRRNGNFDIFGALVDNTTGAVTTNDIVVCNAAGDQLRPTTTFDAVSGQFLVVWGDSRTAGDPNIFGARVTTAGAVLDANGVAISTATNGQFTPVATFLTGTGLVAWEDRRSDTQGDIFGTRVTLGSALTVLDPAGFTISGVATAGQQSAPTAASLTGSFVVAWTDGRTVNTTGTDVYGQQVGTNGSLNGASFVISAGPENEDLPSLADSTTTGTRIAYTKVRADLQTVRVETRTITLSSGTGQACSNPAQCSTGFCVDSKCCDTACGGSNKTDCQACNNSTTGQPDGTCSFVPAVSLCRNYANTFCDQREYCTGASVDCPPDVGKNQGLVCNSTTGTVCPSNAAPGPHGCP